jgi:ABC-type Fe3+ transport system substrate-binding protein
LSQFPDFKLTIVVDFSKYHDVRIDNQLATSSLVPDVVQLQTQQDFTRWKDMGTLLPYKPSGFSALYPAFKDPDGAWVSIAVYAFSYMYDDTLGNAGPATPRDLAEPRWKGQAPRRGQALPELADLPRRAAELLRRLVGCVPT